MTPRSRRLLAASACLMLAGGSKHPLLCQSILVQRISDDPVYTAPPATVGDALHEMTSRAGVIFLGTVIAVRNLTEEEQTPATAYVEVEFRVEQGVLGPTTGSNYVVREWAGLWQDGPRFLPGQRRLMLLHAPGPGGLSSPVDGLDGAIPVTAGDPEASTAPRVDREFNPHTAAVQHAVAPTPTATSRVDLRWIQTKTLRTVVNPGRPIPLREDEVPVPIPLTTVPIGFTPNDPGAVTTASSDDPQPPLEQVLGLMRIWQATRDASR